MSSHEQTLAAIEAFYDAALEESLWPAALEKLTRLMGSQAASLWVLDGSEKPRLPTFECLNFDEESIAEYLNGMAALDPTNHYLMAHPREAIVHDGLVEGRRDAGTRAYNDWHERRVYTRFRIVGQARGVAPGVQAGVALHRTSGAGRYESRDIGKFELLHRHLERALAISFRMSTLDSMQSFSERWLDGSEAGIVLLDEQGNVVFANDRAQAMHLEADGFRLTKKGIALGTKREDARLQRLIAETIASGTAGGETHGGVMRGTRLSGRKPYGITVTRVPAASSAFSLFRPAVCVAISDPEARPVGLDARLRMLFGLTEAEARLAALLAQGRELREAAEALEVTYGTARTRLAQIFQKTDTRRQAELVGLVLKTGNRD